jgi:hypothetical protein
MDITPMYLEITRWEIDELNAKQLLINVDCYSKVRCAYKPKTTEKIGVIMDWVANISSLSGNAVSCEGRQVFFCEVDSTTEEDVREILEFSFKDFHSALNKKAKEEGITVKPFNHKIEQGLVELTLNFLHDEVRIT